MANRLATSMSPYLRQHADNPVDWWPWGDEAFAEAARRDVPLLISIGYAACHWCHVMAHESFEHEATAEQMNADFVCVKVDREEHPDVDAVYMEATQAMTGSGGWPMTVFATPEGKPFYCGTYFPLHPRQGMPGFTQLLFAISEAWKDRRSEVLGSAAQITAELGKSHDFGVGAPVSAVDLDHAVTLVAQGIDHTNGGFGTAPKFPPSTVLQFMLRHHGRTGSGLASRVVELTCERMARGGMYDQLAGGFARYSVDATWTVPHFEKMLYDNALLARVYAGWWRLDGDPLAARIAIETAEFMVRDLGTEQGGIASALDADADGEEGTTYVWTPAQLIEVLGQSDGLWAADLLGVSESGTFEQGSSVLQLPADPDDQQRWNVVRERLLKARAARVQPSRDDKVVASWNGLAITALCEVATTLARPDLIVYAERIAELLMQLHLIDGRLRRVSLRGEVGEPMGVLEDYALVASGLMSLHQVTAERRWLDHATALLDVAIHRFANPERSGSYFDSADDAHALVVRPSDPTDGPTPAGVAALAEALVTATALTGEVHYRDRADEILHALSPIVQRAPRAAGWIGAVAEAALAGPLEVAIVGEDGPERDALVAVARAAAPSGSVLVAGTPGSAAPLLLDRPGIVPTAYVCRGFVCDAPVSTVDELRAALA